MWQPKAFADTWQRTGAHTHTHPAFNAFCHLCLLFLKCFCSVYYMFFLQSVAAMTWCILFSLFTFVATLIYNKIFPEHVATISKYVCFILFPCHQSPSITINHHQSPSITMHGNPWFHPQAPAVRTELEKAQGTGGHWCRDGEWISEWCF